MNYNITNTGHVLSDLYKSEINFCISSFWDGETRG